jgi:hypothetical protein
MRRLSLGLSVSLVLLASMLAPAYSQKKPPREGHPLIRRAVNALQGAKADLQDAKHDYCGHRVEALEATNNALGQLQQALACDKASSGDEFVAAAEPSGGGEPHPRIYNAINALGAAEGDLQNAAHDYCGHRVAALQAVENALAQLKAAVQCDKK